MKVRRILALVLSAALAVTTLTACTSAKDEASQKSADNQTATLSYDTVKMVFRYVRGGTADCWATRRNGKNLLMLRSCRCLWGIFLEWAPARPARPLSDARFLLTPAIILSRALRNAVRRSL